MKCFAYLLTLLLIMTQVDNAWVAAPASPSDPLVDTDDDYLPAHRRPKQEEPASHREPVFVGLHSPAADVAPARRGASFEWDRTTPFTPPPLYVFMSLQT
jgi:hypothetical protein